MIFSLVLNFVIPPNLWELVEDTDFVPEIPEIPGIPGIPEVLGIPEFPEISGVLVMRIILMWTLPSHVLSKIAVWD